MEQVKMTREEWRSWAMSLSPGDKVIVGTFTRLIPETVKKVTSAGWVVTSNSGTYGQTKWRDRYTQRGGYNEIFPFTEYLWSKAIEQQKERERKEKINNTICKAKMVAHNWRYGKNTVDYELAKKILALAGESEE